MLSTLIHARTLRPFWVCIYFRFAANCFHMQSAFHLVTAKTKKKRLSVSLSVFHPLPLSLILSVSL